MATVIYADIEGEKQGHISAGCSSVLSIGNRSQKGHENQVYLYSFDHDMSREQNVSHHPIILNKPIDKSSPLLGVALSGNERLQVVIYMYRIDSTGRLEKFYTVKLKDAYLFSISQHCPNSLLQSDVQPYEVISIAYKSIDWTHVAGTSGYSIWDERVY